MRSKRRPYFFSILLFTSLTILLIIPTTTFTNTGSDLYKKIPPSEKMREKSTLAPAKSLSFRPSAELGEITTGITEGTLVAGEKNYYTFAYTAGISITIDLISPEFDTFLRIYRDGALIEENDDGGTNTNSQIVYSSDASGVLRIEVDSYSSSEGGAYTLQISFPTIISSERLVLIADQQGRFTLKTVDEKKMLYFDDFRPWSSWSTIVIDSQSYTNRSDSFIGIAIEAVTVINSQRIRGAWRRDNIEIQMNLYFVRGLTSGQLDNVAIEWTLTNLDSQSHQVGFRELLDTMIAGNDGAPFFIPEMGGQTQELELTGDRIPDFIQVMDDLANPTLRGEISFGGAHKPDIFQLALWPDAYNLPTSEYQITPTKSITDDSAVHMVWNQQSLSPGHSRTFIVYYGLGGAEVVSTEELTVTLTGPEQLSIDASQYSPNPFNIQANIENIGAAASNVVAVLTLPAGLELMPNDERSRSLGTINPNQVASPTWRVRATGDPIGALKYSVTITSNGLEPITIERIIRVPDITDTSPIIIESGYEKREIGSISAILLLPQGQGPLVTRERETFIAASAEMTGAGSPISRIVRFKPSGATTDFLTLNDASADNQIVNIFWVAENTMGVVIGPPLNNPGSLPKYKLLYVEGPFSAVMVRPWGIY
ncbi:MAG: hypothetical protein C4527_16350 [Candidatus Omnitrophota bacterium]|jgi:hypothetical protein|nr:MAG: hypothetical protein C4527_16350 [Candidatus Omnitrophota bacterium]